MKKRLIRICLGLVLSLLMSTSVDAACAEGRELTGKNGHVYCISNVAINWYSAFAWCDAQGRSLATIEQICDIDDTQKWDGNFGDGKCLNMNDTTSYISVWSSLPYGLEHAVVVELSKGKIRTEGRGSLYNYFPICW